VAATVGLLRSALTEPRVRAFVYTSSSVANGQPGPGLELRIDSGTWDHDIVARFSDYPPPYRAEDSMNVYSASKIRAEQAVWEFERQEKPHFRINTVLPDFIMGRIVGPSGITAGAILGALEGKVSGWLPPRYMTDVVDTARVHLIAAVDGSVAGERILNYSYPFNFNDVLDLVRELRPGSRLPDNNPALGRDLRKVDNARGAELLKKWYGQNGWTSLKESLIQNIKGRD
jgi:nucleoside-diphosphate-sugar epimerase